MPLSLRRGTVSAISEQHDDFLRLEVDGTVCVAYPRLTGPVEVGDEVLVNVQARQLELGSGGFDVLYANLTRGLELTAEPGAHVMSLPDTPLQTATRHLEEDGELAASLDGLPVVCCSLHSQLAPVCAGLGAGLRVAYVQLGGGALPVSLSDTVRALKDRGLLQVAIGVAPCLDGDRQAVTTASALAWCAAQDFEAAVCGIGPGIVGTGSRLGHGGLAAAEAANAAGALGGRPVLAVRMSDADPRERHRGISHHSKAVLELCAVDVGVASEDVDVEGWREACAGLPLSHMGRGVEEDPAFFRAAFAAGRLARSFAA
jgi:hypothetical protein